MKSQDQITSLKLELKCVCVGKKITQQHIRFTLVLKLGDYYPKLPDGEVEVN